MLLLLTLLLILLIPIGLGFGLAVYLKREYDNPTPPPAEADAAPVSENVLDLLKASSVSQDIQLAKNKIQEEEPEATPPEENKLDAFLDEQPQPAPQATDAFDDEPEEEDEQDDLLARAMSHLKDVPSQPEPPASEEDDENPLLHEQNDLIAKAMSTLHDAATDNESAEQPQEELLGEYFDFDAFKSAIDSSIDKSEEEPQVEEELLGKDFDFDALKNATVETVEEEPQVEEELLGKDFDFDALKNATVETVEEEPQVELNEEPENKITKSTFENIPVYGAVPEELLETHLCMDQEVLPEAVISGMLDVRDSFTVVPDMLLQRFEIDAGPGSERFVQTQDAAIALRSKKKKPPDQS